MRLHRLTLTNFAGIKAGTYEFNGVSTDIYGDNGTGKTTVFDSLSWLLFGRASDPDVTDFTPKTKAANGDAHYLDHSAEAVLELPGGRLLTLKKVYREVYKKRRGSASEEFDGHTIDCFIDGVPAKEKEFSQLVEEFGGGGGEGTEKLRILALPHYFSESLKWDMRRRILLEICGDVSDEDVIRTSHELADLPGYLLKPGTADQYYSVDEYRKIAAARKRDINRELEGIPGRIDEVDRSMPDTAGVTVETTESNLNALNAKMQELHQQRADASNSAAADLRRRLSEADADTANARAAHLERVNKYNEDTRRRINEMQTRLRENQTQVFETSAGILMLEMSLTEMQTLRDELLTQYRLVSAEQWDDANCTCPTCKRQLPDDDIEQMRSDFNARRSDRLAAINSRGKTEASQEMIDALSTQLKERRSALKACEELAARTNADIEQETRGILSTDFNDTTEAKALSDARNAILALIDDVESTNREFLRTKDAEIAATDVEILSWQNKKLAIAMAQSSLKRREELIAQENDLSNEFEILEHGIYLCETFIRAKVNLLNDNINGHFQNIRFKLFEEQINGGLKECCEAMIPSPGGNMVPYNHANNAAKINARLEIIDALSRHWGISMPIFVDNAESVTQLYSPGAQLIRLIVSEHDKTLRVENSLQPEFERKAS